MTSEVSQSLAIDTRLLQAFVIRGIISKTSIQKVLLFAKVIIYKSATSPNKFSRGITPTKADSRGPSVELDLCHVDTNLSKKKCQVFILYGNTVKFGKLPFSKVQ